MAGVKRQDEILVERINLTMRIRSDGEWVDIIGLTHGRFEVKYFVMIWKSDGKQTFVRYGMPVRVEFDVADEEWGRST